MWTAVGLIVSACLMIHVVVLVHEWGHGWLAKSVGQPIASMTMGFGPLLWSKVCRDGCRLYLRLIPLGGHVRLANANTHIQKPRAYLLILLGGPLANIVMAWMVMGLLYGIGFQDHRTILGAITPGSLADAAGMQANTVITSVADTPVSHWHELVYPLLKHHGTGTSVTLTTSMLSGLNRQRHRLNLQYVPMPLLSKGLFHAIGFQPYQPFVPARVVALDPEGPAQHAGMKRDDIILAVAEQPVASWHAAVDIIQQHPNQTVPFLVQRAGQRLVQNIHLGSRLSSAWQREGYLGVRSPGAHWPAYAQQQVRSPWWACLGVSAQYLWQQAQTMLLAIQLLLVHKLPWSMLSGPIGIANLAVQSLHGGLYTTLHVFALLHLMVALINLLPLPGLDGGQMVMTILGMLRRRPICPRWQALITQLTWIAILVLVAQLTIRDIGRMITMPSSPTHQT